ncbi:AAA family ATPase [Hamadaea tsunoensis]|uniref:AAA family ATPase n=1 Tax=Hamadaea tsunoensis TaxID=53368 RepID=UPI000423DE87|nr:AAA family ATPase [Hamadaea tsunoensis]
MAERIVLVNGLPGSGKTTLAGLLGKALGVPVIGKDALKEALYVPGVVPEQLGRLASDVMWRLAAITPGTAVLESWWFKPRDLAYAEAGWRCCGEPDLIEVWCDVPPVVARDRVLARSRPDTVYQDAQRLATAWDDWAEHAEPLEIGGVVRVDTTAGVHMGDLVRVLTARRGVATCPESEPSSDSAGPDRRTTEI